MTQFDNIVGLFGMPRSGTTIIARLISNHSKVVKIVEPYQSKRASQYAVIEPGRLCADFNVVELPGCSLLVKETTTRRDNLRNLSGLMHTSAELDYRVAYIFVLRSPLEAYLSQVEAAESLWKRQLGFGLTESSVKTFWKTFADCAEMFLEFAYRFHRRFVFYDRFVMDPNGEVARMMGLFGYSLEADQMTLTADDPSFGGDPRARSATDKFLPSKDREADVAGLDDRFGSVPEFRQLQRLHVYLKDSANQRNLSDDIIRDIALMVRKP